MRYGLLLIGFLLGGSLFAQRTIRWAQLNFAQGINNPAALAIDGKAMFDLIGRNQWFGFDGAPTTFAFNGQYELMEDMAVGLNVFHDRIGHIQTTAVSAQYSYRLFRANGDFLALGLGAGIDNYIANYEDAILITQNDPAFNYSFSRVMFQGSIGAYYYAPTFYVGFSCPEIFKPKFIAGGNSKLKVQPHAYFSAGFYIDAGPNFVLNPHLQVKATYEAPIAGDLIIRNTFRNRFSFVFGFRTEMSAIAGVDFLITPNVRAGYSFNYDVYKLARAKGMSNELYIGVALPSYRNDRNEFAKRRYVDKKGGFKRDYRRKYNSKNKIRTNRFH